MSGRVANRQHPTNLTDLLSKTIEIVGLIDGSRALNPLSAEFLELANPGRLLQVLERMDGLTSVFEQD